MAQKVEVYVPDKLIESAAREELKKLENKVRRQEKKIKELQICVKTQDSRIKRADQIIEDFRYVINKHYDPYEDM